MLVLGLALYGCGSSSTSGTGGSGGSTGGSGGSTGGSGGSTGGSGGSTGGSGGSTGGSGGATGGSGGATGGSGGATGGSGGAAGGSDGGAGAGGAGGGDGGTSAVDWVNCPASGALPGVSAMDFCTQYEKACMYDMTGGTAMMERFKNMGDCMSGYTGAGDGKKACMAYHLCAASKPENKTMHCPHPPEAVLATPTGPCKDK